MTALDSAVLQSRCTTMNEASHMTEVVLPGIMVDLSKHTLESLSASSSSRSAELEEQANDAVLATNGATTCFNALRFARQRTDP